MTPDVLPPRRSADEVGDDGDRIILFKDLTIKLGSRVVLDKQSLAIRPGEVTVLMGPSGVGKSILADVAFGLSGRTTNVSITGAVGPMAEEGALAFQEGGGLPHLTVENNLRLVSSDRKRIGELADGFDIRLGQVVSTLSGGERRRIAFVRSVLAARQLLWLDEPEAGLDPERVRQLEEMIKKQAGDKRSLVVTTHNVDFAKNIATQIIFFGTDGRLLPISPDVVRSEEIDGLLEELFSRGTSGIEAVSDAEAAQQGTVDAARAGANPPGRSAVRVVLNCLTQMPESVPFLAAFLWRKHTRQTLFRSFGLAWLRGVVYYPFIGVVFGLVFVMTFQIVAADFVLSAPLLVQEFGPIFVLRFAPPISAILVASAAGSTIASWIGQMSAERHLDSLEVLGVRTRRCILGPAWWGLFVAFVMHVLAFAIATIFVFVAYVWVNNFNNCGGYVGQPTFLEQIIQFLQRLQNNCGGSVEPLNAFLQKLQEDKQYPGALSKIAGYGMIVASVVIGCSGSDLRTSSDVSIAITRSIVWCSIIVMSIELITIFAGFIQ